ncbi:MAG: glutathione synthase [Geminicoccaceae bacterium]
MSLAVAIQMDPLDSIDIDADSTFRMALEAQERGHGLYHYLPGQLTYRQGRVVARARPFRLRRVRGDHVSFDAAEIIDLAAVDVVLMRQDPPFNMSYISCTHLLERIHPTTLVVNDPVEVRNAPEKLFVTHFADLMPPTLISHDPMEIRAFRAEHKDIIVKPLFGNGGIGVFHLTENDENLGSLIDMFHAASPDPLMVQRYIPEIRQGDKRIILVEGKPVGAINRVPPHGDARANMHAGARPEPATLSKRDEEICAAIGPALADKGLIFVGIDVIGDYLTEINVTSPTGIQEIERFDGTNVAALIWDAIEAKVRAGQAKPA